MRVMVLVKATENSESGMLPTAEMLEAMGRYMMNSATSASCATQMA